jgi:type IX secretion system PorP/SprF family membrane protein
MPKFDDLTMREFLFFVLVMVIGCLDLGAQQDADFSMYLFDNLYINPAYAGSHEALNATIMYRDQWVKMPGAPQTASVAVHSPLPDDHIALGFTYTNDRIGVTQTNNAEASFAYRILVGKKKDIRLSFGICAGFDNYHADLNSVPTTDPNDPSFVGNYQNRWLPNVGAGFYAYSDNFFAGFSVPRILANRLNGPTALFATSTGIARQYQNLLAQAGYVFNIGKKIKFVPSLLLMYAPKYAPPSFDFNANFIFINRIFLGIGYRLNDSYQFTLAGNVTKQIRIGYCYDLTVSNLNKYTTGTHEVMASFEVGLKHGKFVKDNPIKFF